MNNPFTLDLWGRSPLTPKLVAPAGYDALDLELDPEACVAVDQLLALSDQEIVQIVDSVLVKRPHLRVELAKPRIPGRAAKGTEVQMSARSMRRFNGDLPLAMEPTPRTQREMTARGPPPANGHEPVVQFSTSHSFVSETEGSVEVGVMRLGCLAGRAEVGYYTEDISAFAGRTYEEAKGTLVFQPGEAWNYFKIGILGNEEWEVTSVFSVKLSHEGLIGAQMGRSLTSTRIHVINDDSFPTNMYTAEIKANDRDQIPPIGLLCEYLKMQWQNEKIRVGSKKLIMIGQCQNLYFLAKLFMNMYLLKTILKPASSDEEYHAKRTALLVIAACTVIPFAVLHFLEWHKFEWKVGGMSRAMLQKAILRKYLTCDTTAKGELKDGILIMGVARDAGHLVSSGYMGFIGLLNTVGNLFFLCTFQCMAPIVFQLPPRMAAFIPMAIFPVVLGLVMSFRNKMSIDLIIDRNDQESDIVEEIVETTKDYQLIMDFDARGRTMEDFGREINEFNACDKQSLQLLCNNAHFAPWITVLFLAAYTFTGGREVISGDLTLATYLTNVAVFTQMGAAYGHILQTLVAIQTSFPALLRITKLLNVESDDQTRCSWIRCNSDTSAQLVKKYYNERLARQRQNGEEPHSDIDFIPIDMLPIWVRDLSLTHLHTKACTQHNPCDIQPSLFLSGFVELKQGRLISLIGPHSEGKTTLLKVLGGAVLPDIEVVAQGQVFVPCHLRVIHITSEAVFYRGSLMDNVTYGVRQGDSDGDKSRVKAIFRHLGLPGNVINLLEEDCMHYDNWLDVLSISQRHLLSIARALIANPQVICIHKPTDKYSEVQGKQVLGVLKLFVDGGGLEQSGKGLIVKQKPRPRTCIMTNVNLFAKDYADDIIFVSRQGVRRIDKEDVREDMIT